MASSTLGRSEEQKEYPYVVVALDLVAVANEASLRLNISIRPPEEV